MIGKIPIVALENLMESGVSLLVLNYTDDAVGMISLTVTDMRTATIYRMEIQLYV